MDVFIPPTAKELRHGKLKYLQHVDASSMMGEDGPPTPRMRELANLFRDLAHWTAAPFKKARRNFIKQRKLLPEPRKTLP